MGNDAIWRAIPSGIFVVARINSSLIHFWLLGCRPTSNKSPKGSEVIEFPLGVHWKSKGGILSRRRKEWKQASFLILIIVHGVKLLARDWMCVAQGCVSWHRIILSPIQDVLQWFQTMPSPDLGIPGDRKEIRLRRPAGGSKRCRVTMSLHLAPFLCLSDAPFYVPLHLPCTPLLPPFYAYPMPRGRPDIFAERLWITTEERLLLIDLEVPHPWSATPLHSAPSAGAVTWAKTCCKLLLY